MVSSEELKKRFVEVGRLIIWSDNDLKYEDDWKTKIDAAYPKLSEEQKIQQMFKFNAGYLDDEYGDLNITIGTPIIVIKEICDENSRHSAYEMIFSANIRDCLTIDKDSYATEWYLDKDKDFRCEVFYPSGISEHYLYRAFRGETTMEQMLRFQSHITKGTATKSEITRFTKRLGDEICTAKEWDFPDNLMKQSKCTLKER